MLHVCWGDYQACLKISDMQVIDITNDARLPRKKQLFCSIALFKMFKGFETNGAKVDYSRDFSRESSIIVPIILAMIND